MRETVRWEGSVNVALSLLEAREHSLRRRLHRTYARVVQDRRLKASSFLVTNNMAGTQPFGVYLRR